MAVQIIKGNIFESNCQTIVNPINTVGKMGKGLALEFKNRYPEMYIDYAKKCSKNKVKMGEPYLYQDNGAFESKNILNFPTVQHWRDKASIEDIEKGLAYLHSHYKEWGVTSLAVPALGCGCAGLQWSKVKPILLKHFEEYDIPVEIYQPH